MLPPNSVCDGEVVAWAGDRLSFDLLQQRLAAPPRPGPAVWRASTPCSPFRVRISAAASSMTADRSWKPLPPGRRRCSCPPSQFSITARKDRAVTAAINSIPDTAWTTIRYPKAVFDEELRQWVSDAEVAEIPFTAFASRGKTQQVTARLIVRRVRDANPAHVVANAQGELFPV